MVSKPVAHLGNHLVFASSSSLEDIFGGVMLGSPTSPGSSIGVQLIYLLGNSLNANWF